MLNYCHEALADIEDSENIENVLTILISAVVLGFQIAAIHTIAEIALYAEKVQVARTSERAIVTSIGLDHLKLSSRNEKISISLKTLAGRDISFSAEEIASNAEFCDSKIGSIKTLTFDSHYNRKTRVLEKISLQKVC